MLHYFNVSGLLDNVYSCRLKQQVISFAINDAIGYIQRLCFRAKFDLATHLKDNLKYR